MNAAILHVLIHQEIMDSPAWELNQQLMVFELLLGLFQAEPTRLIRKNKFRVLGF